MDKALEYILKYPNFAPVQLGEKHQKELDLPKHCKVADVRKALEAKKSLEKKVKSDVKMVEELKDLTEL